jgi:hypothetical protein
VVAPHTHIPKPLQAPAVPAAQLALPEQRHAPELQMKPGGQARPHAPQFCALLERSKQPAGVWQHTSLAPHAAPPLQVHWSMPPVAGLHTSPARQVTLPVVVAHWQRPFERQVPPDVLVRQRVLTALQPHRLFGSEPCPHTRPFCAVQLLPHPPQLVAFSLTASSQPSSAVGAAGCAQLAKPRSHVEVHLPALQARDATVCAEHARPQAPQ